MCGANPHRINTYLHLVMRYCDRHGRWKNMGGKQYNW